MKISVIGGGSTYTPELVKGFLERAEQLPLEELWLMDIDPDRLEIVGGFARRMAQAADAPFEVVLTSDRREAVASSSYVVTQLRVGQMQARREDEYLGARHGLIGQETTGVGGMAKALRTIPVILDIAGDLQQLAEPGALLLNFTNPAGLVTQALNEYAPAVQSVGVCNVPITTKMDILERLERSLGEKLDPQSASLDPQSASLDPQSASLDTLGLNHLSWHRGFVLNGEDVWGQFMQAYLSDLQEDPHPPWDARTIQALGMLPNYYLQYYYHTARKLVEQGGWPPSRAEQVMQVEEELLRQYADPDLDEPPPDLMKRGGAYYSTVATQLINAHFNDLGETHILNLPNDGAVADWPANWVLEMPAQVKRQGITPLAAQPLPPVCFGLIAQVKCYELLTVKAAVHGDRISAYHALLAHPLGPAADQVQAVLDDMLETHRIYLPNFWQD